MSERSTAADQIARALVYLAKTKVKAERERVIFFAKSGEYNPLGR